ncbi:AAA-domain-containing protein, partial [Gymnopus androsaceus JB14]
LSTPFSNVILDDKIKQALRSIVTLPLLYPQQFSSGILAREAISGALLYGPPGTGKTMICRALACEGGARMLLIKPSDVQEKYVGESEKFIKGLFQLAYRLAPCVVFIDEVEAIFKARTDSVPIWHVSMAMDGLTSGASGVSNKKKGVVLVGATNRPFDIDPAFLRRLPYRMLVDLPPEPQREEILKTHLTGEKLEDVDLKRIAAKTKGYSGSDLKSKLIA